MKEVDSYLNNHLAGSVSALEVTDHWARAHEGEALGGFFEQIEAEIKADQNRLRDIMHFSRRGRKQDAQGRRMGSGKGWSGAIDDCRR
jgi:hypothetical protein